MKHVSFETARLAKKKGFDYHCRGKIDCSFYHLIKDNVIAADIPTHYNEMFAPIKNWNVDIMTNRGRLDRYTSLPSQDLLKDWLREKHKIHVSINVWEDQSAENSKEFYETNIVDVNDNWYTFAVGSFYEDYYVAMEELLVTALDLVKVNEDNKQE